MRKKFGWRAIMPQNRCAKGNRLTKIKYLQTALSAAGDSEAVNEASAFPTPR
jgi:hypothetical protein